MAKPDLEARIPTLGALGALSDRRVFTGIMRDITERKRAEAELRQQREELAHLTRVSTIPVEGEEGRETAV